MVFNPFNLLKLKEKYKVFKEEHPDMTAFGKALNRHALVEGCRLEIRAATPEGRVIKNEITLSQNDIEIVRLFISE